MIQYCTRPHCANINGHRNKASHFMASNTWIIARCDACLNDTLEAFTHLHTQYTDLSEEEYVNLCCIYEIMKS